MHIAMVAARYFPFMGGIETVVHETARRLAGWGHRVVILTTDPSGTLPTEETRDGMLIRRVKAWPKTKDYYIAPGIYNDLAEQRYDLVHIQGYHTFVAPIGMLAAIRHRIPFVVNFHAGHHPSRLRNALRAVQWRMLAPLVGRAERLIGCSAFEAALFAKGMRLDPARFTLIYNGSSMPPPSDPPPPVEPHLILSIGRLERYKGHHRAIAAMPHLLQRIRDARLQIVGSGSYEPELRQLVGSLGLGEHVSFTSIPPDERRRLSDLLHSARLVVLFSEFEANPVAVMEALAAKRPVLVADTSGLRELVTNGWCRSVALDASPAALATEMAAELEGLHQPSAAASVPSWDDCASQLLALYESVLAGHKMDRAGTPTRAIQACTIPSGRDTAG